jgi:hypothetical protein
MFVAIVTYMIQKREIVNLHDELDRCVADTVTYTKNALRSLAISFDQEIEHPMVRWLFSSQPGVFNTAFGLGQREFNWTFQLFKFIMYPDDKQAKEWYSM